MPPEIQTSFIPKKPVASEQMPKAHSFNILGLLATVIFIASILSAAGLYFYETSLVSQIDNMSSSLEKSKGAFEPSLISDLQTLDKRLNSSRDILASHITASPIFKILEESTLKSVRFNKFDFSFAGEANSKIEIKMSGRTSSAGGYRSIALQSNKLSENKYIKDIIFSNLLLTQDGGVSFDLNFTVDPSLILYEKKISQENA